MVSKLPRWVWAGGFFLAFIAGAVNAVGLLDFQHQGLSHMTGSTTLMGVAAVRGEGASFLHLFALASSFFLGALLSGVVVSDNVLRLTPQYGFSLGLESALLFAAVPLLARRWPMGEYLVCCACGLQNAMATAYSGAVVRTTHLTGIFTDLGIMAGHGLRGMSFDGKRARLYLSILGGFVSGAAGGAFLFDAWGHRALLVPAGILGAGAALYLGLFPRIRRGIT